MNLGQRAYRSGGSLRSLGEDYHRDPTADQIRTLRRLSRELPATRPAMTVGETEGLLDFLSNIPIIGGIAQGLGLASAPSSGAAPSGGAAPGAGAGAGGLSLPGLGNLAQLPQQLLSMLGAGLGGIPGIQLGGTGPLPGLFGQTAQGLYGAPAMPPQNLLGQLSPDSVAYQQLAQHTSAAGRAIVNRLLGAQVPQLAEIQRLLERRAAQIQATAEHRTLTSAEEWRRRVLDLLSRGPTGSGTAAIGTPLEQVLTTMGETAGRSRY